MEKREVVLDEDRLTAARRAFIRTSGLAAAGAATLGIGALAPGSAEAASANDIAVFNFALNLEYLEAEFYQRAAFGRGLNNADITGPGTPGTVTGGSKVPFQSSTVRGYAEEIAGDEQQHVRFIRQLLGGSKVARPKLNLTTSFTTAARAAGVISGSQTFNPFANEANFLLGAFLFEDVGVTAFKGAARLIQDKDLLEAAAGILAVEAYHAGEIRTLLFGRGLAGPANKISAARGQLSGNPATDQGISVAGKINIIPTLPGSGVVPSRTTAQVLNIVYLGGAPNNFGFFPSRFNGAIR